jgi:CrcB protein
VLKLALIFGAGGLGALARYGVQSAIGRATATSFPVGTLLVNVLGCFAIGYLATLFAGSVPLREEYRFAVLVGLLGGFTTFSTFGLETVALLESGAWAQASANVVLSSSLAILAVWVGHRLAGG